MKFELTEGTTLLVDGMVIGRFRENRLTLDLGWLDAAGVGITVLGDGSVDRRRKVLERPEVTVTQTTLPDTA